MKRPIGVFDSGIGGITVLKELVKELPGEDFIYFGDSLNAPYGPRTVNEIKDFCKKIINFLIEQNSKVIVVACNTATAAAVSEMRKIYNIPIIGLEPAVKPACLNTRTANIGVLATEGTFRGDHFKNTSDRYKDYVRIHLQVAKNLVELAEKGVFTGEQVDREVTTYIDPLKKLNVDQIVLGCTHYAFFHESITKIAGPDIQIVDSAKPVSRRTKDILMTNRILEKDRKNQEISFYTTGDTGVMDVVIKKYLLFEDIEATNISI